jgi:glycerate 2-kinase
VDPARLVNAALANTRTPTLPQSVVAAGKAARGMFSAAATLIPVKAGVVTVVTPETRIDAEGVDVFVAGHPSPDQGSVEAGERALHLAQRSANDGGLLVLLSGGASAMFVAPSNGITLRDKLDVARRLMEAGAPIHELNCVRKHLSRVKGGRLAAAAGRSITLALSDVHGPIPDDPSVIGSGPTVPDGTTFADALAIIRNRRVEAPPAVIAHLERGLRGEADESIKPGDPRITAAVYTVIGNRNTAVEGAKRAAEALGYRVATIAPATVGEAREAGRAFLNEARQLAAGQPRPFCVIGAGETTVTVKGRGTGGRNQEFALAVAADLHLLGSAVVLGSAGTDGIDGPTDAAGAIVDTTTIDRASRIGLDWNVALANNDAYHFFEPLGDLVMWGPTGTNVGDLHVLVIG